MNRAFQGFWQQKRAGTKPAQVGRDAHLTPTDIFYIIETDKLEFENHKIMSDYCSP